MVNRICFYLGILLLPSCSLLGYGVPDYVPIGGRNHCTLALFDDYTCTKYHFSLPDKSYMQHNQVQQQQYPCSPRQLEIGVTN